MDKRQRKNGESLLRLALKARSRFGYIDSFDDYFRRILCPHLTQQDLENIDGGDTPTIVIDFIKYFADYIKPKKVLDPSVGVGILIREVSDILCNNSEIIGIDINDSNINICNKFSESDSINYFCGDLIDILKNKKSRFDLIFGDTNSVEGDIYGTTVIIESLNYLNNGGYALFTKQDTFLDDKDFQELINIKGVSLIGVIKIPAGSYYNSNSPSNILIFKKGESKDIFLGNLNDNNAKALVNNFFTGKGNSDCRCLPKDKLFSYKWDEQIWFESFVKLSKSGLVEPIKGLKIKQGKDINFDIPNSIYIEDCLYDINMPLKLDLTAKNDGKWIATHIQIVLPSKYNPKILESFYKSESNNKNFLVHYKFKEYITESGDTVTVENIDNITIFYPKINESKILKLTNKLDILTNIVNSLNDDLNLNYLGNFDKVFSSIDKINILDEDELLLYNFPTSIRKQYVIYKNEMAAEHYRQAFDFIDHIFYSTSIICLCVFWGGLVSDDNLLEKYKNKILDAVQRFEVFGYGDIVYLYYAFIEIYNDILKNNQNGYELITSIYGTTNITLLKSLMNKKIPNYIKSFSEIRNKFAHGGAANEKIYKDEIENNANDLLKSFISSVSQLKNLTIFICGDGHFDDNDDSSDYKAKITVFKGDNPKVIEKSLKGTPRKNRLYFLIADDGNYITMPCLIEYDRIFQSDVEKSSYFYSRKDRKSNNISYHTYENIEEKEKVISYDSIKKDKLFIELINKK